MDHSKIIETLKLANNGYTFARNLTEEEVMAAEDAVKDGKVKVIRDRFTMNWRDNTTRYMVA